MQRFATSQTNIIEETEIHLAKGIRILVFVCFVRQCVYFTFCVEQLWFILFWTVDRFSFRIFKHFEQTSTYSTVDFMQTSSFFLRNRLRSEFTHRPHFSRCVCFRAKSKSPSQSQNQYQLPKHSGAFFFLGQIPKHIKTNIKNKQTMSNILNKLYIRILLTRFDTH